MEDDRAGIRPEARALAAELREIAETLASTELAPDDLDEAHRLAQGMRQRLAGPARSRWYDSDDPDARRSPEARRSYLALSPIRGLVNPIAPPLLLDRGTRPDGSPCLVGVVRLGRRYEGPPHGVHGGWVAALFDEALGATQALVDATAMTAVLKVRYRRVTPVERPLRFEAWVHEHRGRRLVAHATCHAGERLTAEAEGIFLCVDFEDVERRMSGAGGPPETPA